MKKNHYMQQKETCEGISELEYQRQKEHKKGLSQGQEWFLGITKQQQGLKQQEIRALLSKNEQKMLKGIKSVLRKKIIPEE